MFCKKLLKLFLCLLLTPMPLLAASDSGPAVGAAAPNLIGRTLDDQSWRLKSDLGQAKVINFFWVGCQPCRQEMPELAKLEKQYPHIKFMSVHTQEETPENILKFVKSLPAAPSHIIQTSGGVQETFNVKGLPHTLVLDAKNNVLLNLSGYTPANMQRLQQLLQKLGKQAG